MLSEGLKKALMLAGAAMITACFVCILLLSQALSLEKDKQQKVAPVEEYAVPVLPAEPLPFVPGAGEAAEQQSDEPLMTFAVLGGAADKTGAGNLNEPALRGALSQIKENEQAEFAFVLGDLTSGSMLGENASSNLHRWLEIATEYFPESFFYPCFGLQESAHKGRNRIWQSGADRSHPDNAEKVEKNYKIQVFSELFNAFEPDNLCHTAYGRTVYHLRRGDCNFYVLNTKWYDQMDRVSDAVRKWMAKIAENGAAFNFVFLYGTPFPTSAVGMEMDAPYSTTIDDFDSPPNRAFRDEFWKLVDSLPGAALFCGSEQLYIRKTIDERYGAYQNNVPQISTAGLHGAFDTARNDPRMPDAGPYHRAHYIVGELYGDRTVFTIKDAGDSSVLDSFTVIGGK